MDINIINKIYKYRKYSQLSLKEILYGELLFSSLNELNDPYDTKVYYCFKKDYKKYYRLLKNVVNNLKLGINNINFKLLANYLSETDLSYEELIKKVSTNHFKELLLSELFITKLPEAITVCELIIRQLKYEIHKYVGRYIYVSSFTKTIEDPVIWSHYADEHQGFAIEISPLNNEIFQNPLRRQIKSKRADGTFEYLPGTQYEFKKVKYQNRIVPLDGFLNFNAYIYGKKVNQQYKNAFWEDYQDIPTTKYSKWKYENEYRLIDYSHWMPDKVDENGPKQKRIVDRIYYYDQTQLTGIVFGINITENNKSEIIKTIITMRNILKWHCHFCLPIFYFYNAIQTHSTYKIEIKSYLGLDVNNSEFEPNESVEKINNFNQILNIVKKRNKIDDLCNTIFNR